MRRSVALVSAIAVALGSWVTWTSAAAAQDTLRFGKIPSTLRSVGSLYLFIAERKGFFARERIVLQSVIIEGGTDRMVAALDAGTIDVTHSSTPYLISAVL